MQASELLRLLFFLCVDVCVFMTVRSAPQKRRMELGSGMKFRLRAFALFCFDVIGPFISLSSMQPRRATRRWAGPFEGWRRSTTIELQPSKDEDDLNPKVHISL